MTQGKLFNFRVVRYSCHVQFTREKQWQQLKGQTVYILICNVNFTAAVKEMGTILEKKLSTDNFRSSRKKNTKDRENQ